MNHEPNRRLQTGHWLLGIAVLAAAMLIGSSPVGQAQDEGGPSAVAPTTPSSDASDTSLDPGADAAKEKIEGINVFSLLVKGGWFMVPIVLMSLLVVTFMIERFMALRRDKLLPEALIRGLGELAGPQGGFDPRAAYRLCQQYPSAAATVIRSMLLKVGRPQAEVEHAVAEAAEREADRIYANVRWLNLAAAVTPLMGLLGTVWGMIRAFHDTTQLAPGQNKADYLAQGIYVALVTTLGGLVVAIPAAILSHYFEGKITKLFHEIDELLFSLMPQVERFEGRVRFSQPVADKDLVAPPREAEPRSAATAAAE